MAWSNGPLIVYHGTDNVSAGHIRTQGIDPGKLRSKTDFGAGFYVTTVQHQAEQWANQRCRRTAGAATAEVLRYEVARTAIENLSHLCFVMDDADYYAFIGYCRSGAPNHGPSPRRQSYEIICGPVSLWPQRLVIAACDQILFSDPARFQVSKSPCNDYLHKEAVSSSESRRNMPQVDPRSLDYSCEMKAYFRELSEILVRRFRKSPEEAHELVNRYFALEVDPLERAFLMHTEAESVAADLSEAG